MITLFVNGQSGFWFTQKCYSNKILIHPRYRFLLGFWHELWLCHTSLWMNQTLNKQQNWTKHVLWLISVILAHGLFLLFNIEIIWIKGCVPSDLMIGKDHMQNSLVHVCLWVSNIAIWALPDWLYRLAKGKHELTCRSLFMLLRSFLGGHFISTILYMSLMGQWETPKH